VRSLVRFHLLASGAVFGHQPEYVEIKHLTRLIACIMVSTTSRQPAPVNLNPLDLVRIINLFQRCADMALLAARFFTAFVFGFFYNTGFETGLFPPDISAVALKNQTDGHLSMIITVIIDLAQASLVNE
jgi:hypothetical protein